MNLVESATSETSADQPENAVEEDTDLNSYLYHLKTVSNVLRWSSDRTWSTLANGVALVDGTGMQALTTRKDLLTSFVWMVLT